ncbi:MAG: radical SAM protein [Candidatus Altiarchaeota archaeon]|nr:radical SAM protein [Candidatus Altiarchaeota archaeon]
MTSSEKIAALGEAGRWDLSSTILTTGMEKEGLVPGTIYPSFSDNTKFSLFKTLMTNACSFDCRYCENSKYCKKKIFSYEPGELAKVFAQLYSNRQVDGLFLSSGVAGDPDTTMRKMVDAIKLIREKFGFRGYIHLKVLPGSSRDLITEARAYANRLSINIEAPNKARLDELSSMKDFDRDILRRQEWIRDLKPSGGQTTQMIVGAAEETDLEILKTADWEYETMGLRRVYYSPFKPLPETPLEKRENTPQARVHRLYCVDFMLRKYGIPLDEFREVMAEGNLPPGDPKVHLALERFDEPLDLNNAGYEDLIRIPGIGPVTAYCITALQNKSLPLRKRRQLQSLGVRLKRAQPFLKIDGHSQKKLSEYKQ